ncbi:MAG: SLBB domain-containing protein [Ignavibacteria bacterium]|jgi:hypothetical protein
MKKILLFLVFGLFFSMNLFAQEDSFRLGAAGSGSYNRQGGFFDYSDPTTINFTVSVWGEVKYPGKYLVPVSTGVQDLLSYAGGPTVNSDLEDLRLYSIDFETNKEKLIKFSINDLLWGKDLQYSERNIPELRANDILLIPRRDRLFFTEWFGIVSQTISLAISLTILILNITD